MRVDVWDIKKEEDIVPLDCGYPRDFLDHFTFDRAIGKGGFGQVRVVIEKSTGLEFACKSIKKNLDIPNISSEKLAQHLDNIDREAKILKKLRGTLSVVHFKGAWEDDVDVHLVMEFCRGGELSHSIGMRMYTEETVAGYMRSVLHTLAQCHSHRILHRDIKPGNFMLLTEAENSPLKAIDFGLAAFFDPEQLPRTDLGLDGTPWFMAPEVLNSQTLPASDVWSAGVMAYQLLSGYLPFDDVRNPHSPALSLIWRGILTEEPSFRRSAWTEVSAEAKDFIKILLNKDPEQRPSAKDALKHPWLQTSFHVGKKARPLSTTVVQRIQRYAQTNVLRRTILELMAGELMKLAPPKLSDPSMRGGTGIFGGGSSVGGSGRGGSAMTFSPTGAGTLGTSPGGDSDGPAGTISSQGDGSNHSGAVFPMSPEKGSLLDGGGGAGVPAPSPSGSIPIAAAAAGNANTIGGSLGRYGSLDLSGHGMRAFHRSPSLQQIATLAAAANRNAFRGAATVHGPSDYWRIMRQASELAAIGSGHGQMNYLRAVPRTERERQEQRKAARLSLDTSAHGGGRFAEFMKKIEESEAGGEHMKRKISVGGMRSSVSMGALSRHGEGLASSGGSGLLAAEVAAAGGGGRDGNKAIHDNTSMPAENNSVFLPVVPESTSGNDTAVPMQTDTMERGGRGRSLAFMALQAGGEEKEKQGNDNDGQMKAVDAPKPDLSLGSGVRTVKRVTFNSPNESTKTENQTEQAGGLSHLQQQIAAATAATNIAPSSSSAMDQDGSSLHRAGSHTGPVTNPQELESLMRKLHFRSDRSLGKEALADGLRQLGYDLDPSEMAVLMDQLDLDADQSVAPSEFLASQMDWGLMQRSNRDLWLECAKRAFADLDVNSDGRLTSQDLVASLRNKLPAEEVDFALEDAMMEVGGVDPDEIDFEGFLKMLHVGSFESLDSLDQYDDRMKRSSLDGAGGLLDSSMHGSGMRLETVPEDQAPPEK
jgi:serine/threonine protein kinase/Ca2+-binding EF-hand superfamily protein